MNFISIVSKKIFSHDEWKKQYTNEWLKSFLKFFQEY